MTGEVEVELRRQITQRIQDLPPTGTFAERTLGVQRIIQSVVQATAADNPNVAPSFQIGIQRDTGECQLSEVTDSVDSIIWQDI